MRISLEQNKYADFSLNIPFWDVRTGEMLTLEMFVSYIIYISMRILLLFSRDPSQIYQFEDSF